MNRFDRVGNPRNDGASHFYGIDFACLRYADGVGFVRGEHGVSNGGDYALLWCENNKGVWAHHQELAIIPHKCRGNRFGRLEADVTALISGAQRRTKCEWLGKRRMDEHVLRNVNSKGGGVG